MMMAALKVEAILSSTKVVGGSHLKPAVCVSVTDDAGRPVSGLKQSQFTLTVFETPVGPNYDLFLPIVIDGVSEKPEPLGPGFYLVSLSLPVNFT
jgi:hypothetical protein